VKKIDKATLLLGVKGPSRERVWRDKIYMYFAHMTKGQPRNMLLLKKFMKNKATLIDCEKVTDVHGRRLIFFGRFAGICGITDSLFYLGEKLKWKGVDNPFTLLKPSWRYRSLEELKKDMARISRQIRGKGFNNKMSPLIIGITGHGNVSKGVQEILGLLNAAEVHPKDMGKFIKHQKYAHNEIYKIVFLREEKLRAKNGKGFYFEEYLEHPNRFESNLDNYLPYLNMLVHTSYWDRRYPRMVTKEMIKKAYRRKNVRLELISDISCDIMGSIEFTHKTTSLANPAYTYDPKKDAYVDGFKGEGVTVLAIDNLPAELPKDSSKDFSSLIRDYVYQISAHGARDITDHTAIPAEIRKAVIVQQGRFTKGYKYLKKDLA
jgi:alpha-aminoadipic semialdehyde synthase